MPMIDMIATGLNIKKLKNRAGLTVTDMMNVLGFTNPNAIYKWMRGDSLPTIDNLVVLADMLNVRIDEILIVRKNSNTAVA